MLLRIVKNVVNCVIAKRLTSLVVLEKLSVRAREDVEGFADSISFINRSCRVGFLVSLSFLNFSRKSWSFVFEHSADSTPGSFLAINCFNLSI